MLGVGRSVKQIARISRKARLEWSSLRETLDVNVSLDSVTARIPTDSSYQR